jgi:hypothetical protein
MNGLHFCSDSEYYDSKFCPLSELSPQYMESALLDMCSARSAPQLNQLQHVNSSSSFVGTGTRAMPNVPTGMSSSGGNGGGGFVVGTFASPPGGSRSASSSTGRGIMGTAANNNPHVIGYGPHEQQRGVTGGGGSDEEGKFAHQYLQPLAAGTADSRNPGMADVSANPLHSAAARDDAESIQLRKLDENTIVKSDSSSVNTGICADNAAVSASLPVAMEANANSSVGEYGGDITNNAPTAGSRNYAASSADSTGYVSTAQQQSTSPIAAPPNRCRGAARTLTPVRLMSDSSSKQQQQQSTVSTPAGNPYSSATPSTIVEVAGNEGAVLAGTTDSVVSAPPLLSISHGNEGLTGTTTHSTTSSRGPSHLNPSQQQQGTAQPPLLYSNDCDDDLSASLGMSRAELDQQHAMMLQFEENRRTATENNTGGGGNKSGGSSNRNNNRKDNGSEKNSCVCS